MNISIPGLEDIVEIGRGGFATVYRAYQPTFSRTVALKVVENVETDEVAQERFRRECQAMGLLSEHPSIVTILDAGFLDDGRAYLVMPFMPAGTLADRVRSSGAMKWDEASRVAVKLAGALHAAHDAGVIHRDVKPANVLISEYGEPKLADFGIARVAGAGETQAGTVTASLAFAAPEVIDGKSPSFLSDIYSLGATIYLLLTGRPPFEIGRDASLGALMQRILRELPRNLRDFEVPDRFAEIIETAMAKDPEDRYDSAASFGRAVRLVQDEEGLKPTELTILKVEAIPDTSTDAPGRESDSADLHTTESATGDDDAVADGALPAMTRDLPADPESLSATGTLEEVSPPKPDRRRALVIAGIAAATLAAVVVTVVIATSGGSDVAAQGDTTVPTTTSDRSGVAVPGDTTMPTTGSAGTTPAAVGGSDPTAEGFDPFAPRTTLPIQTPADVCPGGLERPESVDFSGRNLSGTVLECLDLSGARFEGTDLSDTQWIGVDLSNAEFIGNNLIGATSWRAVSVDGARFSSGAALHHTVERSDLRGIELVDVNLDILLIDSNADGVDFSRWQEDNVVNAWDSSLRGADLTGTAINMYRSDLTQAILVEAWLGEMYDSSLVAADLTSASFAQGLRESDLTDAITIGVTVDPAVVWGNTVCPDGSTSNENLGVCDLDGD